MKYRVVKITANITGIPRELVREGFLYFLEAAETSREIVAEASDRSETDKIWEAVYKNKGYISDTEMIGYRLEAVLDYSLPL